MMWNNIMLGATIVALVCYVFLAFMGTTISAWHAIIWIIGIIPSLIDQIPDH